MQSRQPRMRGGKQRRGCRPEGCVQRNAHAAAAAEDCAHRRRSISHISALRLLGGPCFASCPLSCCRGCCEGAAAAALPSAPAAGEPATVLRVAGGGDARCRSPSSFSSMACSTDWICRRMIQAARV
jgi:hypothetical protein